MRQIYIGLMSGTSIDAMDGVLVEFNAGSVDVLATASKKWAESEASKLHRLCREGDNEIEQAGSAKIAIADISTEVIKDLLEKSGVEAREVIAVGAHGQTIRHRPGKGFTIQLNDGPRIAANCNIDTIVDFRSADIAKHGQGAPLTPAFHQMIFGSHDHARLVLNLGGIANLTVMGPNGRVLEGFDSGPANTLIDLACRKLLNLPFDKDAKIALRGTVDNYWLGSFLTHPFLKQKPPKSSGREDFNELTIAPQLNSCRHNPERIADLIRTLCEFTVVASTNAITESIKDFNLKDPELILCGGGARNPLILERFRQLLASHGVKVFTSDDFGVAADSLESIAFAWFARLFMNGITAPLKRATGAREDCILGSLCPAIDGFFARNCQKMFNNANLEEQRRSQSRGHYSETDNASYENDPQLHLQAYAEPADTPPAAESKPAVKSAGIARAYAKKH